MIETKRKLGIKRRLNRFKYKWLSLTTGCLFSLLYLLFSGSDKMPSSLDNLFLGGIAIYSALASFLLASKAIIFSIDERYIIQQLKKTKTYNNLVMTFVSAIRWSLASLVLCMVGLYLNFEPYQKWHNYFFASWVLIVVTAICSCYRVVDVLSKTLMAQPPTKT